MSATDPTGPRFAARDRQSILGASERLLDVLCQFLTLEFDPLGAREAVSHAFQDADSHRQTSDMVALARASRAMGLRLHPTSLSVREALAQVSPDTPLVTRSARPDAPWLAVLERKGRGALVARPGASDEPAWVSEGELAAELGLADASVPTPWAVVSAQMPCAGLSTAAHSGPEHHAHGPSPLRRLLGLLRAESRDLWVVAVFIVGVGLLSLAVPITVEILVQSVQGNNTLAQQVVVVLSLVLLVALSLAGAMRILQTYVVELIQRRVFVRVVADLAYRLPRVRASAFDREHGPELVNRFFDVMTVQKAGATLLLDGLAVVTQAAIGLCVLAMWHPWLLGFNLGLLVALIFLIWVLGRGAVTAKIRESYAKYAVAGWLEEMVRHPLAFKLSSGQDYAQERADALARVYLGARVGSFRILFRQIVFSISLQACASALMLGLGGYLVIRNELQPGQLVAAELIVALVVGSFVKLGKSFESYYDLLAAVDKLGHLVDLPLERASGEAHRPPAGPASLHVRHLSFGYEGDDHPAEAHAGGGKHPAGGGHPHHGVLRDLELSVAPGERVALIGPSGAGKSTLVEVLYGLREPVAGRVELDGVDVRELALDSLREQVAAVILTETGAEVFDGTVIENVRLGRPWLSLSGVRSALATAGLLEDVLELPAGLQTRLVVGGAPLSHGQVQRLLLARAIAGQPRLLVLDETLDGFDSEARRAVIAGVFDRANPWTLVVVTHHPDVLAACDRVIRLPGSGHAHGTNGHAGQYPRTH